MGIELKNTNKVIIGYDNISKYLMPIMLCLNDYGSVEIYATGKTIPKAISIVRMFEKIGLECEERKEKLDKALCRVFVLRKK